MRRRTALTDATEPVYGTTAVADISGMDAATVVRAIQAGELRAFRTKPNTGHYRIKQSWLDEWLERLEVSPLANADTTATA